MCQLQNIFASQKSSFWNIYLRGSEEYNSFHFSAEWIDGKMFLSVKSAQFWQVLILKYVLLEKKNVLEYVPLLRRLT